MLCPLLLATTLIWCYVHVTHNSATKRRWRAHCTMMHVPLSLFCLSATNSAHRDHACCATGRPAAGLHDDGRRTAAPSSNEASCEGD